MKCEHHCTIGAMEQKITKEQVEHIAKLCNLNLTPEQTDRLSSLLTQTLDYINILEELDTKDIGETYQVTGLTNVFQQEGEIPTTLTKKESLSTAMEVVDGKFATKAIFDRS